MSLHVFSSSDDFKRRRRRLLTVMLCQLLGICAVFLIAHMVILGYATLKQPRLLLDYRLYVHLSAIFGGAIVASILFCNGWRRLNPYS